MFSLRPHQRSAVDSILRELRVSDRTQIHMACGSGKTLVAGEVIGIMAPRLVVWLSPTLELMAESEHALRHVLPSHRRLLVGSGGGARRTTMTTDVDRICENLSEPSFVFSTYTSFPRLVEALRVVGLSPDLLVSDEAHRTAGHEGRLFAQWLNSGLPGKRLAMTATPRQVVARDGTVPTSMDNQSQFGSVAYRYPFSQAVADQIICDIEAIVPVVDGSGGVEAQIEALRQAQRHYGLQRILSFHSSIAEAKAFTDGLQRAGVHALHVNGRSTESQLAAAKEALRSARQIVVTNARVFGEGVDVPALDAVFFADFKESTTDIAQQIGRAVRRGPGKSLGYVILPPTTSTDLGETLSRGRYGRLWRMVSGVLDLTENPDHRTVGNSPQIRFSGVGEVSPRLSELLQGGVSRLLYLRRFSVAERAWIVRAEEVLAYLLAGNPPYADASPHKMWISDNGIAFRAGQLNREQHCLYAKIQSAMDAPKEERLIRARQYVEGLEKGEPTDYALTCLVRNNRRNKGFAGLYRRMLAVRHKSGLARRARLIAFIEAYERGEVTDRSIYAQLVSGVNDPILAERFSRAHERRLSEIADKRRRRQQEAVRRFRAGEPAKQIARDLGVTPSSIWYWDRHSPIGTGDPATVMKEA